MNPYREEPAQIQIRTTPRQADNPRAKGIVLIISCVWLGLPFIDTRQRDAAIAGVLLGVIVGIQLVILGRRRDPRARLVRLTWHRGHRIVATLVGLRVLSFRYSEKRKARIRAERAAREALIPPDMIGGLYYTKKGLFGFPTMSLTPPRRRAK